MIVEGGNLSTRIKKPSNELHRHRIQDTAMTGRRETVQWWDSHEAWIWPTDNMSSFYLRIKKNTAFKRQRPSGYECWSQYREFLYSKNHAKTLLCAMRRPVFQHLACTATTVPYRFNYINNASFVDPQHLPHHLLRILSNWTIRHKSNGEIFVTKTSLFSFIHLPIKMEPIEGSETSAIRNKTPGNYPKENNYILLSSYTSSNPTRREPWNDARRSPFRKTSTHHRAELLQEQRMFCSLWCPVHYKHVP